MESPRSRVGASYRPVEFSTISLPSDPAQTFLEAKGRQNGIIASHRACKCCQANGLRPSVEHGQLQIAKDLATEQPAMRAQCLVFIAGLLCSWETSPRFSGTFLARCALTLRGGGTNARPWPPASHGLVDGSAFQQLDLRLPSGVQRALVDWQRRGLPPPTLRLSLGGADFLHLGHARAALLNDYIAKSCNGSLVVRFEDMDCSVLPEAEDAVLQELALLGIKVDRTARASDNADVLMAACERSIREGRAYVDELRRDTVMGCNPLLPESACRGSSTSENLARWSEMVAGSGAYCVRARLNLSSSLPILHDPVLFYSTSSSPSSAGETQLHCQPSATFSVPVLDHALGVSFVLLSSHPRGRDEQYRAMCAIAGIPPPPELRLVDHVSCLSDAPLNTLMLQRLMLGGGVKGCHDLSLPTVRGLLHQGLQPAALRVFALLSSGLGQQRGHKGVNVCMTAPGVVEESVLWKINKQMLVDRGECERFTVLDSASMCKMMLRGCVDLDTNVSTGESEDGETMQTVLLEEFDAASVREGDKISLLNWPSAGTARSGARVGHFRVIGMQFDAQGNTVRLLGELMSQNPDLETTKSFCWLPDP